jgi:hypothetical protein
MNQEERIYNLAEFAAAAPAASNPGESLPAKVGAAAPEFQATTIDGTTVSLGDFRGQRHVVIMTGAVTSPMCAFEVPEFNRLQEEFNNKGVSFFLLYTRESHPAARYIPGHIDVVSERAARLRINPHQFLVVVVAR